MSETVSVPRHLLELLQERLDPHRDAPAWAEVCALLSAPAQTLDDRLRATGMISVADRMAGAPLDAFIKHAGVHDLSTFIQWVEMRRTECLRLQARFELEERGTDDELYEWALAHAAVFSEVHVNLRAAIAGEWVDIEQRRPDDHKADYLIVTSSGDVAMSDWIHDDEIGWCFWYDPEATHWMPLPAPPAKKDDA